MSNFLVVFAEEKAHFVDSIISEVQLKHLCHNLSAIFKEFYPVKGGLDTASGEVHPLWGW